MGSILNIANVAGWGATLAVIIYNLVSGPEEMHLKDLSLAVLMVKAIQIFQILDIVLIVVGKSKGSLLASIAQITGRLIVALVFLEQSTDTLSFGLMATMWCIADLTRYIYYLTRNALTTMARYNFFLVLYPTGVYGEMLVINNYIKRHAVELSLNEINMIRVVQVGIVIGMVFLYIHMLKLKFKALYGDNNKPKARSSDNQPKVQNGNNQPKANKMEKPKPKRA